MNYTFTTQPEIRKAFWQGLDSALFTHILYRKLDALENDEVYNYKAHVKCEFVEFVDRLRRDELISECLAKRVTL
ncbi:hypothetical protein [uncultured Mediterranean phage uvMED]|nr:hypothetical protein [uncultured Mediterranean phage uvMED]